MKTFQEFLQESSDDAYAAVIAKRDHKYAKASGATHENIMEAHKAKANLEDYSIERGNGHSHQKALKRVSK